jgi:hypothetical protein
LHLSAQSDRTTLAIVAPLVNRVLAVVGIYAALGLAVTPFVDWYSFTKAGRGHNPGTISSNAWAHGHRFVFAEPATGLLALAVLAVGALTAGYFIRARWAFLVAVLVGLLSIDLVAIAIGSPPHMASPVLNYCQPHETVLAVSGSDCTRITAKPGAWIALGAAVAVALTSAFAVVLAGFKRCPDCGRSVGARARVCRFCGHRFFAERPQAPSPYSPPPWRKQAP